MSDDLDRAVEALRRGGLVAIPTETVYGLAADAENPIAVGRIFTVKGRPRGHPLIVHIARADLLPEWVRDVPPAAAVLADACWPGPLTLLLPRGGRVIDAVTGGRDTVGIRVPAHPLTAELLERFGGGVAAPSANRFGHVSPTTADHVRRDLGDAVDVILDGGPSPIGVESTIVDCSVDPPQVLRPGAITREQIDALLAGNVAGASGASRAPGMLAAHYAPAARVLLAEDDASARARAASEGGALVIGAGVDVVVYARHLYEWLRDADARGVSTVVAVLPAAEGLGHAIRDRLIKAAAGRAG